MMPMSNPGMCAADPTLGSSSLGLTPNQPTDMLQMDPQTMMMMLQRLGSPLGLAQQSRDVADQTPIGPLAQAILQMLTGGQSDQMPEDEIAQIMQLLPMLQGQGQQQQPGMQQGQPQGQPQMPGSVMI